MEIQLTKRTYLGDGYVHRFKNDTTGEVIYEECTQEEYERLGLPGGSQFNPVKLGHTWTGSMGKTIKVDTSNSLLGVNDYCEMPDGRIVLNYNKRIIDATKEEVTDSKIEESLIVNRKQ